jgi:hypothetical protein
VAFVSVSPDGGNVNACRMLRGKPLAKRPLKTKRIILKLIFWKWAFSISDIGSLAAGTHTSEIEITTNDLLYPTDNPYFDTESNFILDLITVATYFCRCSYEVR